MITSKKIIIHMGIGVATFFLLIGTLFIPQPVNFPDRTVNLGFPIHYYTLDFGSPYTSMGGAPDHILKRYKFNILSSWEQKTESSWKNFISSYMIIFLTIEVAYLAINHMKPKGSKK